MVYILEESYKVLKLELAMIIDVGTDVVKLCYQQEGDGFLAPTAYSHWQNVMLRLSNIADENVPIVEKFQYLPITDFPRLFDHFSTTKRLKTDSRFDYLTVLKTAKALVARRRVTESWNNA